MKLTTCLLNKSKDELIMFISERSSRYRDKLIDFMYQYKLTNLQQATVEQLKEYIQNNFSTTTTEIEQNKK